MSYTPKRYDGQVGVEKVNDFLRRGFLLKTGPALLSLPDHSCADRSELTQKEYVVPR